MPESTEPTQTQPRTTDTPRLPFFEFARDLCGFFYIDAWEREGQKIPRSTLNWEMADYHERIVNAWMDTRFSLRKRVKVAYIIPRKGRKSTLITQAGPAYELALDNNLSIGIDSEKKENSNTFLRSTAAIMGGKTNSPWVKYLGNWNQPECLWRDDRIVVYPRTYAQRKDPSIFTLSIEIGAVGAAPDIIHIDDPMSIETHTDIWMQQVRKHYEGLGPVLVPNGLFVLCMTRYDDGDLYGHIERTEGVHVCDGPTAEACIRAGRCTNASEEFPQPWHVMFKSAWDDHERSIDEAVWDSDFLHAEHKKSPGWFAAQFLNNPWHDPDASFQPEDFKYAAEVPPDVTTILTSDIAWKNPKASKLERGGDWNVLIRGKHHWKEGRVYIDQIKRGRWTEAEWGDQLVHTLRESKKPGPPVSRMVYEELRGGASFGHIANVIKSVCARTRDLAPALVKAIRSTAADAKAQRVKSCAVYFQNGAVIFVRPCKNTQYNHDCAQCKEFQVLRNELLKFGATTYDDAAEAMSDQFHPEIYHPPAVQVATPITPVHRYQYDDILRPAVEQQGEMVMVLDENDRPVWYQPDTYYYPRETIQ
jgi:hypothetical protein